MRFIQPLTVCAVAAVALSLVACTAAPSSDDGANGRGETEEFVSPLTPYREAFYGPGALTDEQQEEKRERDTMYEEKVTACMKDQGFDYTPAEPDSENERNQSSAEDDEAAEEYAWYPDDEEWVENWGYGIVDYPGRVESEEAAAAEPVPEDDDSEDSGDPYYDSLSESQKVAYDEALFGPPVDKDAIEADENYEYNWEEYGCSGKALHEVEDEDGEEATFDPAQYQDLTDRMNAVSDEIATDPKIAELDAAWVNCMDEAGEAGFTAQADARNSFQIAFDELYSAAIESGEGGEMTAEPDLSPDTNPEVAALRDREIATALADLECREETSYQEKWELAVEQVG